jgi:hypothetical protein
MMAHFGQQLWMHLGREGRLMQRRLADSLLPTAFWWLSLGLQAFLLSGWHATVQHCWPAAWIAAVGQPAADHVVGGRSVVAGGQRQRQPEFLAPERVPPEPFVAG